MLMRIDKIHILDNSLHRQALYARHLEQAGYEVAVVNGKLDYPSVVSSSLYFLVSLPHVFPERVNILKRLRSEKGYAYLFVVDSFEYSPEDFKGLNIVGHINRYTLSLSQTMLALTKSLNALLK